MLLELSLAVPVAPDGGDSGSALAGTVILDHMIRANVQAPVAGGGGPLGTQHVADVALDSQPPD